MEELFNRFKTKINKLGNVPASGNAKVSPVSRLQTAFESVVFECQLEDNWTVLLFYLKLQRLVSQSKIPQLLQEITDILVKEAAISTSVGPGSCTERFLNKDMLADLLRISENDVPVGFREEVIKFLTGIISVLDGSILVLACSFLP
jgi:hypothetical protein